MNTIMRFTAALFIMTLFSCDSKTSAPVPLRTVHYPSAVKQTGKTLIVFLPGNKSKPEDFAREGFVDMLHQTYPGIDSIGVDATLGYYTLKTLPERLLEDVIKPARLQGYSTIWLVGISVGGSGALWYLKKYPKTIQGVLLLTPFLADKEVVNEIVQSGGLKKWQPILPLDKDDFQRAQLVWVKQYLDPRIQLPVLVLGYSESDRFEKSNKLLAELLPPKQVFIVPGGHDWKSWKLLFQKFLQSKIL